MFKEFQLTCADGTQLFARAMVADHARAVICVAHGLGEHGGRYDKFAQHMTEHGFSVYVHDSRGHGRNASGKDKGIARMHDLERDMVTMIDYAAKETGLPVIQFGHSLGGLVGLYTTLHAKPNVCAAIITSPWLVLKNPPPKLLFKIAGALSGLLSNMTVANGIASGGLCHDEAVCTAYDADEYNHDRIGLALAGDADKTSGWVMENAGTLAVPMLLCHGEQDPICSVQGSRKFAAKASDQLEYIEFAEEFHELHNEPAVSAALFDAEVRFIERVLKSKKE